MVTAASIRHASPTYHILGQLTIPPIDKLIKSTLLQAQPQSHNPHHCPTEQSHRLEILHGRLLKSRTKLFPGPLIRSLSKPQSLAFQFLADHEAFFGVLVSLFETLFANRLIAAKTGGVVAMKVLLDLTWESIECLQSSEEPCAQGEGDGMPSYLEEAGRYSCFVDSADDLRR
jgi:hypothetical protein